MTLPEPLQMAGVGLKAGWSARLEASPAAPGPRPPLRLGCPSEGLCGRRSPGAALEHQWLRHISEGRQLKDSDPVPLGWTSLKEWESLVAGTVDAKGHTARNLDPDLESPREYVLLFLVQVSVQVELLPRAGEAE